jgi:hypothetical protein
MFYVHNDYLFIALNFQWLQYDHVNINVSYHGWIKNNIFLNHTLLLGISAHGFKWSVHLSLPCLTTWKKLICTCGSLKSQCGSHLLVIGLFCSSNGWMVN